MNVPSNQIHRKLKLARVPKRFWDVSRKTFEATTPVREEFLGYCDDWIDSLSSYLPAKGAYLCSPGPGVGKTAMLAYVLRKAKESGRTISFVEESIWQQILDGTLEGSDEDPKVFLTWAREADIVAIDDIGNMKPSDWSVGQWALLINEWYERGTTVWVASNFTPWDLTKRLMGDDRIASRLLEMVDQVWNLEGEDFRKPVALRG